MWAQLLVYKEISDDKQGLYFWPPVDDISWENYSQILVVLGDPELCENIS